MACEEERGFEIIGAVTISQKRDIHIFECFCFVDWDYLVF
jgi:hypothetical protein